MTNTPEQTATPTASTRTEYRPGAEPTIEAITKRSFATLASVSPAGNPHVAGVLYEHVGDHLFVSTLRTSRKARNIEAHGQVGVCIPIRRLPVGPPSTIHFQARADVLATDDPAITSLVAANQLGSITGHGELDLIDGCFIRIAIPNRLLTYGLGMSLRTLIKDPLSAHGIVNTTGAP